MTTAAPVRGEPLAVEFMNTIWADRDGVHDALASSTLARGWFAAQANRLDSAVLPRLGALVELRDAARVLAAFATGDPRSPTASMGRDVATRIVNAYSKAAAHWTELHWDEGPADRAPVALTRSSSARGGRVLGTLAEAVVAALTADYDLRACIAPGCVLFYARVHDRREWCSPACGNRARVARHYDRHKTHKTH